MDSEEQKAFGRMEARLDMISENLSTIRAEQMRQGKDLSKVERGFNNHLTEHEKSYTRMKMLIASLAVLASFATGMLGWLIG